MVWPGTDAFTPRCAVVPGGYAITTWGNNRVRTTILTPSMFR